MNDFVTKSACYLDANVPSHRWLLILPQEADLRNPEPWYLGR